MTTSIGVSVVLLALGVGVALPVLIQAFITLRTVNRVMTSFDRRLAGTLTDLSRVVGRLDPAPEQNQIASLIGAAVVPAIAAAVRSLRHRDQNAAGVDGTKPDGAATAAVPLVAVP